LEDVERRLELVWLQWRGPRDVEGEFGVLSGAREIGAQQGASCDDEVGLSVGVRKTLARGVHPLLEFLAERDVETGEERPAVGGQSLLLATGPNEGPERERIARDARFAEVVLDHDDGPGGGDPVKRRTQAVAGVFRLHPEQIDQLAAALPALEGQVREEQQRFGTTERTAFER
jgi:hypothetical protein